MRKVLIVSIILGVTIMFTVCELLELPPLSLELFPLLFVELLP